MVPREGGIFVCWFILADLTDGSMVHTYQHSAVFQMDHLAQMGSG